MSPRDTKIAEQFLRTAEFSASKAAEIRKVRPPLPDCLSYSMKLLGQIQVNAGNSTRPSSGPARAPAPE